MKLRKKPVEIEGFQMTAKLMQMSSFSEKELPLWARTALKMDPAEPGALFLATADFRWYVQSDAGAVHVTVDDWILRGVKGELYPCKPDILALTYDVLGPDEEGT